MVTVASRLLVGAPTFGLSINQFQEDLDSQNPSLLLNEFCAIDSNSDKANLTRAASEVNENLYAPTVLERDVLKIESIQTTWLPIWRSEQKAAEVKAQAHMAAVIHIPAPLMTKIRSQKKLQSLLVVGKDKRYYTETEGAPRYIVADDGEKGLTFTVEPIRLAPSESLEGLNRRQKAKSLCR